MTIDELRNYLDFILGDKVPRRKRIDYLKDNYKKE